MRPVDWLFSVAFVLLLAAGSSVGARTPASGFDIEGVRARAPGSIPFRHVWAGLAMSPSDSSNVDLEEASQARAVPALALPLFSPQSPSDGDGAGDFVFLVFLAVTLISASVYLALNPRSFQTRPQRFLRRLLPDRVVDWIVRVFSVVFAIGWAVILVMNVLENLG